LALAACLGIARNASAAQETVQIKGNTCYATYGLPSYNQWGVYNNNNDYLKLNCPVQLPAHPYTTILLAVTGWALVNDINPLSCTVTTTKQDGSGAISNTVNLPYNPNSSVSGSTTVGTPAQSSFTSVSCFIPARSPNFYYSYISSLTVQGFY
jgi:hypothetical protein